MRPVLQAEFGVSEACASLTISSVVLGIALANLPFGMLADRYAIRPTIGTGAFVIAVCGFLSAHTGNFVVLAGTGFISKQTKKAGRLLTLP